jgi:hypothetical protein
LKFGNLDNAAFVRFLYRYILLREATQAEVNFQVVQLVGGGSRIVLARAFLNSPEFRNGTGPRLTSFLLYSTLLLREASAGEKTARLAQISSGTALRNIVAEIVTSAEFLSLL